MGACATKPKVLKADSGEAPAPAPEPAPEDAAASETKLEKAADTKATEIVVHDDKVDSKSPSLGHLLNHQNEGKECTEADPSEKEDTPPESEKQVNPPPEEKTSESKPPEPEPEPPLSDSVTEKTHEAKKENEPNNGSSIQENINETDPPPSEKIHSSEKPTETEKEVKV